MQGCRTSVALEGFVNHTGPRFHPGKHPCIMTEMPRAFLPLQIRTLNLLSWFLFLKGDHDQSI